MRYSAKLMKQRRQASSIGMLASADSKPIPRGQKAAKNVWRA